MAATLVIEVPVTPEFPARASRLPASSRREPAPDTPPPASSTRELIVVELLLTTAAEVKALGAGGAEQLAYAVATGRVVFTHTERWWLDRIVEVIAASAGIAPADLDNPPFIENGGADGAIRDLGDRAATLLEELNQELTA